MMKSFQPTNQDDEGIRVEIMNTSGHEPRVAMTVFDYHCAYPWNSSQTLSMDEASYLAEWLTQVTDEHARGVLRIEAAIDPEETADDADESWLSKWAWKKHEAGEERARQKAHEWALNFCLDIRTPHSLTKPQLIALAMSAYAEGFEHASFKQPDPVEKAKRFLNRTRYRLRNIFVT